MDRIEAIGFDMDYTLAIYQLRELEELAFAMTVERLVAHHGYPASLRGVRYDPGFVIRGLVVDTEQGNLFKMDRHNHVGRGYHGRRPIPDEALRRLYREEKIHLSSARFAWIDTLFALPEACLFAEVIELVERGGGAVDYRQLHADVREAIDTVHRDGSLKAVVMADLPRFLVRDPELGPALHKLRSGGKKLFVLTNSLADYTDAVMRHVLDGQLPEYPSWRNYFDAVVTGAAKPAFFSERRPLLALGPDGQPAGEAAALERGRTYQGGDLSRLEELLGIGGERVLYVGDHIYGDILRSRKSSLWRTCLVVEELESIPINIVLSAQPEAEFRHIRENKGISFKRVPNAFVILDGQHRMWGYHKCPARHRVPVAIYEGLSRADEVRLFVDINTKHQGVPKALILDVKGLAGSETDEEKLLRELFDRLNTDAESPLCAKLSAAQASSGKLSRTAFNTALMRAIRGDSLRRISSRDKQYELVLKFLKSFHDELEDKALLLKRHFFAAIFDLFDEIVKKAKKDHGSVTPASLQAIVHPICNLPEDRLPKTQKRESLVDVMRGMLNSDTSISDDDF